MFVLTKRFKMFKMFKSSNLFPCSTPFLPLLPSFQTSVAVSTFCCGSIHFLLWKLTPLAVAVSTFCCGSIHFLLWQYPLFVVAAHTFGRGSVHFFSVAVQVSWTKWCVAGATFGGIFKPYPLTISQQRIMLEQTAKINLDQFGMF